ncbi:hypothetical protein [Janibacter corallicola]|uniref:hypothetical protein n=1 Tax=Janibacter corallicola TaxID=415212 RepID=UPI0008367DD9|nr:hypothetical protein [Janibacter corallicola]
MPLAPRSRPLVGRDSELAAAAEDAGRLVVAGHCVGAGGTALAWLPFVEVVGEIARSTEALEETIRRHAPSPRYNPAARPMVSTRIPGASRRPCTHC